LFPFGQLLKIADGVQVFGLLLIKAIFYILILTNTGRATFWAIFSQTTSGHPVKKAFKFLKKS
jgi:hypothetical protein